MAAAQVGDHVSVKGRMQSHTFEGQDGKLHRSYDLIAEHVSFIKKETLKKAKREQLPLHCIGCHGNIIKKSGYPIF